MPVVVAHVVNNGLVLIDRRFEGTFGGLDQEGPYRGGHVGTNLRSSETNHFVRSLLAHPKVRKRLESIATDATPNEETVGGGDLLKRILDDVPA